MRTIFVLLTLVVSIATASAESSIETEDPLKAFVFDEYPRGSDYFINGERDTTLIRCIADFNADTRPDIGLSERSIWGNRTGPFELFVQKPNGRFEYWRTADYESELKSRCGNRLQSCRSNEYVSSGKCRWKNGLAK